MSRTLITGACGQLGTDLAQRLRDLKGAENILATDLKPAAEPHVSEGLYEQLDIMDRKRFHDLIAKYEVNEVYHLAAVLSANGESDPIFAWNLNMESLLTVLQAGKTILDKIYWPSSIAVFGKDTPKWNTPQNTIMSPTTVYGISKLAGERWCDYYFSKYGVDVRSLRYPGLIGYKSLPGGGTTDYAVDIFHRAISGETYECFLKENTVLPMMYMDDAVKATIDLMETSPEKVRIRNAYNISALSFSPAELVSEIQKYYPDFRISYKPDFRQEIADSWPHSIDDHKAKMDWGWSPQYELKDLTRTMIHQLKKGIIFN